MNMIFKEAFNDIWSVLNSKSRYSFLFIFSLLLILGFFETLGISFVYLYIGLIAGSSSSLKIQIINDLLHIDLSSYTQGQKIFYGGLFLLAFYFIKNFVSLYLEKLYSYLLRKQASNISVALLETYTNLQYDKLLDFGLPRLKNLINNFPNIFISNFSAILGALSNFLKSLMVITLLFFINDKLALCALVLFSASSFFVFAYTQKEQKKLDRDKKSKKAYQKEIVSNILNGNIYMNVNAAAERFLKHYSLSLDRFTKLQNTQSFLQKVPRAINEVLFVLAIVLTAYFCFKFVQDMKAFVPLLFIFTFAGMKLNNFLSNFVNQIQTLMFTEVQRKDLFLDLKRIAPGILKNSDEDFEIIEKEHEKIKPLSFNEVISLKDLSFSYPDAIEKAFDGFNLEIKKGEFIGICGRSGGGKTTLLHLIMGLLHAQDGEITCDGVNVYDEYKSWLKNIGYVGQTPYLTSGSLKKNIAFGYKDKAANEQRIWECLKMVKIAYLFREYPDKLNTKIKSAAINFSGGQKQRICIARALYKDPSILVLDESTSALDLPIERKIMEVIEAMKGEKTIIFATHRPSALKNADRIIVLDKGKIVDSGSYDELMSRKNEFILQ